jgi:pimeloyl-ACP methyl ester carboxylesterase
MVMKKWRAYETNGGASGVWAVTEDMNRCVDVMIRAKGFMAEVIESAERQKAIAAHAEGQAVGATFMPRWRAEDGVLAILADSGGVVALEGEIQHLARLLERSAQEYIEAERAAHRTLSGVGQAKLAIAHAYDTAMWTNGVVAGVGLMGLAIVSGNPLGMSEHGRSLIPTRPPMTTGYLNRDSLEWWLGHIDNPLPIPGHPSVYEIWTEHLARVLWGLDAILRSEYRIAVGALPQLDPLSAPTNYEDILANLAEVAHVGHGGVEVQKVTQSDGIEAYVVYIPGTDSWLPGDKTAFGPTSNVRGMAGEVTDSMALTLEAMKAAGIPQGAPVMLVGHSQGGMAATALAGSSMVTSMYNVTNVVTAGSPTGRYPRNPDVNYVHFEHSGDITPGADATRNPDLANILTISADLTQSPDPSIAAMAHTIGDIHAPEAYVGTGANVDAHPNDAVRAALKSAEDFLTPGTGASSTTFVPVFSTERPGQTPRPGQVSTSASLLPESLR